MWYIKQPQKCFYCNTEEEILKYLFGKNKIETKRKRGENLEIDRKDTENKYYSEDNCVLACYICNNTKSDMMNSEEFKKYFGDIIHKYLMDKYNNAK